MNEAVSIGALASNIVDPWAWYFAALKNPAEIGKGNLPVHDGDPQTGFFRTRFKGGQWEPVAIWKEDGQWLAYRSGREVRADEIWTFACRNPVSYDAYQDAVAGKGWPDDDAVVAAQAAPPPPGLDDNSSKFDESEAIKDQIDAALKGMDAYKKISDDATAAKALSLRNRLNELSNQADKIRTKLKEPFLEGGKAIDAKYQPLVKSAKAGADTVRDAIGTWETEKLRKQREEERRQAEELRRQQEATRAAEASGAAPEPEVITQPPVAAAPAPIKPTYGKTASVSVKVVVDEVKDWLALAAYMIEHPDLRAKLLELAQRALDAGRTNVPGITTTEAAKVR